MSLGPRPRLGFSSVARQDVPHDFSVRPPSVEDAPAIAELMNEVTLAESGFAWTTAEEVLDELTAPDREQAPPEALLFQDDERLAGYLQFWLPTSPETPVIGIVAYVRPALWGRGLSAWLLRLGETRASERFPHGDPGIVLRVPRFASNEPAGRLFESLGYRIARTFWMMRIELSAPPPAPKVPAAIRIRTFELGRADAALNGALSEAFADHWGGLFETFEQWRH
jgi:mycothiol synthase